MNSYQNPLRDPQDRRLPRIAGPCVLVIFGVTGDLSRKKLMPAVYDLANRGMRGMVVGRVLIPAQGAHLLSTLVDLLLDQLGAQPEILDPPAAATWAVRRRPLAVVAMMTDERGVGPVVGQWDVAIGALHHIAAVAAEDERCCPPAIEEQDRLLATLQCLVHCLRQRTAEDGAIARL